MYYQSGWMGQKTCHLQNEPIYISCSITFHGHLRPIFQWSQEEENTSNDSMIISNYSTTDMELTRLTILDANKLNYGIICTTLINSSTGDNIYIKKDAITLSGMYPIIDLILCYIQFRWK